MIDLDAYFARIGYAGPATATLSTLRAIHALHPAAIPFENLDPLLGLPVALDTDSLQAKMVGNRRGGYCFEQNTLLKSVLEALGFPVTVLAARVLWNAKPGAPPNPRAHMVLRIALDGEDGGEDGGEDWLADVGFGGNLLAAPLRLVLDAAQDTPAGAHRLVRDGDYLILQALLGAGWQNVYQFTLEPQMQIDLDVGNWFTSTHPQSLFRNNLLVQRLTPEARLTLFNTALRRNGFDGRVEESRLTTPAELAAVLTRKFGLELPEAPEHLFARLPPV